MDVVIVLTFPRRRNNDVVETRHSVQHCHRPQGLDSDSGRIDVALGREEAAVVDMAGLPPLCVVHTVCGPLTPLMLVAVNMCVCL